MTSIFRIRLASLAGLCLATLTLTGLSGCQNNKAIVARVNTTAITNDDFEERALRVTADQLQYAQGMDAGALALVSMIHENLVSELAKQKGVEPQPADIQKIVAFTKLSDPRVASAINGGSLTEDDVVRSIRGQMEDFAIGTDGAKAEDKDVQALYNQRKAQGRAGGLVIPETYKIKIVRAPDPTTGQQALDQLKKTGDWKGVATTVLHLTGAEAANAGREQSVDMTRIQPQTLQDALRALQPGQFTPAPIQATITNPQTHAQQPLIVIAQVISKQPERTLTLDEVRPLLQQSVIANTHKDWQAHEQQLLASFTQDLLSKGLLQINIKRYEKLLDTFISPMAASRAGNVSGTTIAPQPAAPPNGSGMSSPAPGGGAGSPAPGGSAPTPQ